MLSVQPVAERGGSDQALLRLVRGLPREEFACHVVVPADPPLRADLQAAGAGVHVVPMRRISTSHGLAGWVGYALAWPVSVGRLVALIRRLRIDVVHSNSLHCWYGWAAAALTRRPHVWHARELVVQSGAALRVERLLARRFADRVVAVSRAVADQLASGNVVVGYDVPDVAEFTAARAGRFRSRIRVPDDVPLVGAVGRIDTWKGFDVLLDAWPAVRAARPDARLVLAGGPVRGKERYAEALAARAAALPGVRWLGPRDDVPDLLADLDLFVLPSTEPEPYGLVLVEALACGVPVVASDAGGPPEILEHAAPGAGRLVPPRDADALSAAIVATVATVPAGSAAARARRANLLALQPSLLALQPVSFAALLHDVGAARAG